MSSLPAIYANPLAGDTSVVWSAFADPGSGASTTDPTVCRGCQIGRQAALSTSVVSPSAEPLKAARAYAADTAGVTSPMRRWKSSGDDLAESYLQALDLAEALPANKKPVFRNASETLAQAKTLLEAACGADCTVCLGTIDSDGTCKPTDSTPRAWVRAATPVYGRHLKQEYINDASSSSAISKDYTLPQSFSELRFRGAKSFCATRRAAQEQANTGAVDLDNWDIASFGDIRVGKVNPSIRLYPPVKKTDEPGSEAFVMPMTIGADLAPLDGLPLLPRLGDMAHPLYWVSADREVASFEDYGSVKNGRKCLAPTVCTQLYRNTYRKTYRDVEHVDVFAGVESDAKLSLGNLLLWDWGIAQLYAGGSISLVTGKLVESSSDAFSLLTPGSYSEPLTGGIGLFPHAKSRSALLDQHDYRPTDVAADTRLRYNGFFYPVNASGVNIDAWRAPVGGSSGSAVRLQMTPADDRSVSVADHYRISLDITGRIGRDFDIPGAPISISAAARSTWSVDVGQTVTLREQQSVVAGGALLPTPAAGYVAQTNLVAVPRVRFQSDIQPLDLKLFFKMQISWYFGSISIDWDETIWSAPVVSLAASDKIGGEGEKLRVGEFSDVGLAAFDGENQALRVFSHLPKKGSVVRSFASFPASVPATEPGGATVASCLADPKLPGTPPPPDGVSPGPSTRRGASCAVVAATSLNSGLAVPSCADPAQYANKIVDAGVYGPCRSDACRACIASTVQFACGPTSKPQSYLGSARIAHVLNGQADVLAWQTIVHDCAQTFAAAEETSKELADDVATKFAREALTIHACQADGTIVGGP